MTAELRFLLDRAAIHDLLVAYARAVDGRDWEGVAACFTPDAECDYHFFRGTTAEVVALIRDGLGRFESTMHFLGNQWIALDGDRAQVETYAIAYHRRAGRDLTVAMRYHDGVVRRGDGWRIARRRLEVVWQRDDAVGPPTSVTSRSG
ncbi:MAG TPA: nuclear transport factor 2 family protein [Candidatus Binatia bacterium]|nr:nuclear transport factor 2 family protein [Candidatus Binatia bacterium]